MFYPLLNIRNIVFCISQLLLNDFEYLQKSANSVLSLLLVFYIVFFRPFRDLISLISIIATEVTLFSIFFIILTRSLMPYFKDDFYFDCCFFGLILFDIFFQYSIIIFVTVKKLIRYFNQERKET